VQDAEHVPIERRVGHGVALPFHAGIHRYEAFVQHQCCGPVHGSISLFPRNIAERYQPFDPDRVFRQLPLYQPSNAAPPPQAIMREWPAGCKRLSGRKSERKINA